jgi:hypothetical protein
MFKRIGFISILLCTMYGCGFPFRCHSERIEISMPAVIERDATREEMTLSGAVAPGNVGVDEFAVLKRILIENTSGQTQGIVWSLTAFNTNGGGLAVAVRPPFMSRDVIPVTGSFQGGGWGRFDLPHGIRAQVSVRTDGFLATSASGTIEILQVAPLRLRIDITVKNESNAMIRIQGDANFRFVRERVPCT